MGWIGREPKYANFPRQTFVGSGGTTYTLDYPGINNGLIVIVGGVWQTPYINFTVVGDQITFDSAVGIGVEVEVLWLGQVPSGVGTMATQDSNAVAITGGSIIGITDLAVADGGTGASTAADARTSLGVAIGTNVAPATSGSSILKGNGSGGFSAASAGTDYAGLASANSFTETQTFRDNKFEIVDNLDTSKKIAFEVSAVSTATTRTVSVTDEVGKLGLIGVKQQIGHWPAGAIKSEITTGASVLSWLESTSNKVMTPYLAFDAATIEYAQFRFRSPKSMDETANFTAIFEWTEAAGATSHDCVWSIAMQAQGDADTIDSVWGTAISVTDTGTSGTLRFSPETAEITPAGTWAAGDEIVVRVYRNASNGADTLDVDAYLIGVTLFGIFAVNTEV